MFRGGGTSPTPRGPPLRGARTDPGWVLDILLSGPPGPLSLADLCLAVDLALAGRALAQASGHPTLPIRTLGLASGKASSARGPCVCVVLLRTDCPEVGGARSTRSGGGSLLPTAARSSVEAPPEATALTTHTGCPGSCGPIRVSAVWSPGTWEGQIDEPPDIFQWAAAHSLPCAFSRPPDAH